MPQEWKLDSMVVRFEEPDILVSRGEGESDANAIRTFNRLAEELARKHGRLYLIADMSKSAAMGPEARKAAGEFTAGASPFQAMVIFGASFAMRTVVNMMMRAAHLLGRTESTLYFVANEADARAWIDAQRAKAAAKPA